MKTEKTIITPKGRIIPPNYWVEIRSITEKGDELIQGRQEYYSRTPVLINMTLISLALGLFLLFIYLCYSKNYPYTPLVFILCCFTLGARPLFKAAFRKNERWDDLLDQPGANLVSEAELNRNLKESDKKYEAKYGPEED